MTRFLILMCISLYFNLAIASELRCDSYAHVRAYCGVGDNNGCTYRNHEEKGKECWVCAAPGAVGDPGDPANQPCPKTGRVHAKNPYECEEVTEAYIICKGNKYILSNETSSSLQRNMKAIEKSLPVKKSGIQTNADQK